MEPLDDLGAADWLVAALPDFRGRVVELATESFPAFARIFHRPDQGSPSEDRPGSWSWIASDRGTVFHPAAQYTDLAQVACRPDAERIPGPLHGSLDRLTLPIVRDHLATHTTTPDECWFALWSGFGSSPERWRDGPTFRLPDGHPYLLFAGALAQVIEISVEFDSAGSGLLARRAWRRLGLLKSPTIWWPQDRAWLVHSQFDYDSTIIGGSLALIEALIGDPAVEALAVDPDTSLYANGDTINGRFPSGWSE